MLEAWSSVNCGGNISTKLVAKMDGARTWDGKYFEQVTTMEKRP
jgi:hypothetical protein